MAIAVCPECWFSLASLIKTGDLRDESPNRLQY
jgi:hypothetical protein